MGLIKKVLRAAVAQPWEYVGEGAPGDWEFRVSPDEQTLAVYDPGRGHWVMLDAGRRRLTTVAEVHSLAEMDDHTEDWRQFLSVEDPDE